MELTTAAQRWEKHMRSRWIQKRRIARRWVPYGFDWKDTLVENTAEMAVVCDIFRWHRHEIPMNAIARRLNKRKVPTKHNTTWRAWTVNRILDRKDMYQPYLKRKAGCETGQMKATKETHQLFGENALYHRAGVPIKIFRREKRYGGEFQKRRSCSTQVGWPVNDGGGSAYGAYGVPVRKVAVPVVLRQQTE